MEEDRQVQRATAQELADKYKWFFIEASAKTKTNVRSVTLRYDLFFLILIYLGHRNFSRNC